MQSLNAAAITTAISSANDAGRPAIIPFFTGGYPDLASFAQTLTTLAAAGDVIEIGVPFTDPLADGVTIQHASEIALRNGVSLRWILDSLKQIRHLHQTPVVLMSYLNPLLSMGYRKLADLSAGSGVAGFIVPDLPYEESEPLRDELARHELALVQLVSPVTPESRMRLLCEASSGFVYAVTVTGVTGGDQKVGGQAVFDYLDKVRQISSLPVCAGFGIRDAEQVKRIGEHAEGVIVGSALVEVLRDGGDVGAFVQSLRSA